MERSNRGLLDSEEKRALVWLAQRTPAAVNSDHLTALGFLSLIAVRLSYWYARYSKAGLILAIVFLILNWFGDSLDGTLARVRDRQRPRYGYYVDHVLDACGALFVFGGLAASGYMSERIAVGLLVAYLLVGNIALLSKPAAHLFDIGGVIGIAGMGIALVWPIGKHGAALYRAETPPGRKPLRRLLARWGKFNSVGIAGFVVQLAVLWALSRFGMHYLLATALAVEIAVLHNFVWHEAWTWPGLPIEHRRRRMVRFHVANGIVSVVSNVLLTWVFKQWLGLPLLAANALAVAAMALLNFALAAAWVFRDNGSDYCPTTVK